jgi:hypothetical protein
MQQFSGQAGIVTRRMQSPASGHKSFSQTKEKVKNRNDECGMMSDELVASSQ